jgi:hypothetical protein
LIQHDRLPARNAFDIMINGCEAPFSNCAPE